MSLSCECPSDDYDDYAWYWWQPQDYSVMPTGRARKRCTSCCELIDHGSLVAKVLRSRPARSDYEESRFGEGDPEAISLATAYMCERCTDIYFTLEELGYCVSPYMSMTGLLKEYHEMVAAKKITEGGR